MKRPSSTSLDCLGCLRHAAALVCSLSLLAACGGAAPGRAAETPAAATAPAQQGYPSSMPPAPPPAPPSAGASSLDSAPSTPSKSGTSRPRDETMRAQIESAQRELELAGSDCAAACRALGSMERATARLCTIEEASCEDVRVRLRRARERVRASCGGCNGGPSVDPDAPIPSK